MKKIKSASQFTAQINLLLSESEARALMAITEYGSKSFLEYFYTNLGKSGLEPHENGLITLFETIRSELPSHLRKIDDVRGVWNNTKIALPKNLSKD